MTLLWPSITRVVVNGVGVALGVGVDVALGVDVAPGVDVGKGVGVDVALGVNVGAGVGVGAEVGVDVGAGVGEGFAVGVGEGRGVGVGLPFGLYFARGRIKSVEDILYATSMPKARCGTSDETALSIRGNDECTIKSSGEPVGCDEKAVRSGTTARALVDAIVKAVAENVRTKDSQTANEVDLIEPP